MKATLLNGAALVSLFAFAAPVHAADAPAPVAAAEGEITEVIVYGQGQSRQLQSVKAADLSLEAAGTSPLKAIDKLPGVSFQSADAFGAYEWSTRISIRGFNQNQTGFTLDGVPLGDMTYGNHNGLHISRAIIGEDVGRVDLTQGAGALSAASTSNLGGTLQFFSRDPSDKLGGEVAGTAGSDAMYRLYGRFETGTLENVGGLRAYVSVADQKADKWKGGSEQKQRQIDAKAVLPLGDGELTGYVNHSERREQDYQDMSFDMIGRLGRDWDNFQPNYALATQVAAAYLNAANYAGATPRLNASGCWTGVGTNPYQGGVTCVDDAYYYGAGIRDDDVMYLGYEGRINDMISVSGTVYNHTNKGQGLWVTPYTPSPNYGVAGATSNNAPLSVRTTEYDVDRTGFFGAVDFDLGAHKLTIGLWTEDNDFNQARRFYAEDAAAPKRNPLDFQSGAFFTQWEYAFNTKTTVAYVQDVWTITDAFKLNYGFKSMTVENSVRRIAGNALSGTIKSDDSFLPQAGFVFKALPEVELFGSYSENMAAYVSAATSGPFSSLSQTNVDYVKNRLKPETSKTVEGGMRLNLNSFRGVVAVYHVDFDNRILAVAQGSSIQGNAPVLSNVGGVKTTGVELAGTWRLNDAWKVYSAYSYNDSKYANDVVAADGTIRARTKNKSVVDTPKHLFNAEVSYDDGALFGTVAAKLTGDRFYTYENIGGKVEGYTTMEATLGYRFPHAIEVQLNVTNLTGADYIATIGSGGFTNSDTAGTAMTILPGAPRQAFVTVRKTF
ncbi:TonB-dependent receptor [Asticcacaulis sp. BYS171W]|uniref:TonB-dependent receptor n=1 Tax=Asticcacaulis aquaticus TaxID=2984212 RepID=A0ABT5HX94_9CAUL|nr:TonB-dependent receptor [Asticcacaulis aquaticus]MDC7684664.1 TonB-dependent receptor [Asticcacaulis aquaticus]